MAAKGNKEEIMEQKVKTIRPGGVNCYLLKADGGCVLIDTGVSS
jgi:glyoxylase-like metal-dependent hydrolase (beta-lactamase superfamily II)